MSDAPRPSGGPETAATPARDLESQLQLFSRAAGMAGILIGGVVLLGGWLFDIVAVRSIPLGSVSMKANTALGLATAGAALWLLQEGATGRRLFAGRICAAVPALVGLLTLAEYGLGRSLGIDELLFLDPDAVAPQFPGRPALNTALAFLLLGLSLLTPGRETRAGQRRSDVYALGAGLIALAGLLGHGVDQQTLLSFVPYSIMALHTAVALLLLAAGLLAVHPRQGLLRDAAIASVDEAASQKLLVVGFVAALGLFAAVAWIDLRHAARMQDVAAWVARTYEVQAGLNRLLGLVGDIEDGTRGFVLTGDPGILEPFERVVKAAEEQHRAIERLILDDEQKDSLSKLEPLIAQRIAVSRRQLEMRRTLGPDAAQREVAKGEGRALMDRIRAEVARMDARQGSLLDQRAAAARRQLGNLEVVTVTGSAVGAALLTGLFAIVLRENRLRRRAQSEVDRFFKLSLDLLCIAGTDGYFKRPNPAFSRTLGHTTDELLARPFLDFVHPEDRSATLAEVARLSQGVPTIQFENRYQCKDGSWRWLSWMAQPVPNEGTLYATARDITELKRAEAEIRQLGAELEHRAAQLEASNQELEAFSYSVSHDLRAPLRAIDGFSQVLLEDHSGQLDAEGRSHLERIRAAAQRMGGLIDDLLMLSRIGQAELRWQAVDVGALAAKAAEELQRREPDREVTFAIEQGLVVQADPRLLRIALDNLIGNAWKFTRKTAGARIWFGAARAEAAASYFVRDNGPGFDMAYADRLFTPFQRLHSPREFEGTGIGLAIVARVVRRHGGAVRAEAALGQGATFYFTLGASAAQAGPEEAKA